MLLLPLITAALAAPTPEAPSPQALASAVEAQRPVITAQGRLPLPTLSAAEWKKVAEGDVVKQRRTDADGVDTAIGVGFIPHPIDQVWVGVLDDVHDDLVADLSESWLPGTVPGHKVLYQHLDLPMPFTDRHWVIVIENTRGLHSASGGAVWERVWDLDPRGDAALAEVPAELQASLGDGFTEAIVTPTNAGGWYFLPAAGGTLAFYQVRTVIGGNIPDELVVRYALSTLDELIEHVAELAERAPGHYRGEHYPIVRPDGSAIPGW